MKKLPCNLCATLFVLTLILTGCASTPSSTELVAPIAMPLDGHSQIVFYRPSGMFGYLMRADIMFDGKKVGNSVPGKKFVIDTTPGSHHVTLPSIMYPGENGLDVVTGNQAISYIKTSIGGASFGGRTNVEVMDDTNGKEESAALTFGEE